MREGQAAAVDANLTGRENLQMVGKLNHLPGAFVTTRTGELLDQFKAHHRGFGSHRADGVPQVARGRGEGGDSNGGNGFGRDSSASSEADVTPRRINARVSAGGVDLYA